VGVRPGGVYRSLLLVCGGTQADRLALGLPANRSATALALDQRALRLLQGGGLGRPGLACRLR
jgi:hypothetical protein